jgi:hypothetical protein
MRAISRLVPGSRSSAGAAPLPSLNAGGPFRFVRGALRNSPWIVIAVSAHVVGIALLSVVYVASHTARVDAGAGTVGIRNAGLEEATAEVVPTVVDRKGSEIKAPPTDVPGPINPTEVVLEDRPPGVRGDKWDSDDYDKTPGALNENPDALPDTLSGAPSGTSIGVGKFGHHGKRPSPWVSLRAGNDGIGGDGHGDGFETGDIGGSKKPRETQKAVWAALEWLMNHQAADGRWDCDGFDACCKGNRCDGVGDAPHDVGVTGLALLCFLGTGETHQSGTNRRCQTAVRNGLRFLRESQDSEGCFGPRTSPHFLYDHACASLAMTEAYGMTGARALRDPAQRGVGFVLRARNPYLAWRYDVPANGENDTSVTGWMVMALKSAKLAELDMEKQAVADAIEWVGKMTDPETGRTGYQNRGSGPARTATTAAKFPTHRSEATTAVGMTVRIFGGHDLKSDAMIGKGADLLAKCLPKWDVDAGTNDFYYWYYGSLAMFQVGGPRWAKWNEAMKTAIVDHQRLDKGRCEYGSWDPVDCWSSEGGRVYATAVNCLTMEVYYRYPLLGVRSEEPTRK